MSSSITTKSLLLGRTVYYSLIQWPLNQGHSSLHDKIGWIHITCLSLPTPKRTLPLIEKRTTETSVLFASSPDFEHHSMLKTESHRAHVSLLCFGRSCCPVDVLIIDLLFSLPHHACSSRFIEPNSSRQVRNIANHARCSQQSEYALWPTMTGKQHQSTCSCALNTTAHNTSSHASLGPMVARGPFDIPATVRVLQCTYCAKWMWNFYAALGELQPSTSYNRDALPDELNFHDRRTSRRPVVSRYRRAQTIRKRELLAARGRSPCRIYFEVP